MKQRLPNRQSPTMLAGTLELTSKVRYGLTSRGVPIFRFIPYDKRFGSFAVGCSHRDLLHNIHAVVEPLPAPPSKGQLPRANLIKNLGRPSYKTEEEVLLTTYAYDSRKELRTLPKPIGNEISFMDARERPLGKTFHIDPPGCKDVDDSFSVYYDANGWKIAINIADVAYHIPEGTLLDYAASQRATSFYTDGVAIVPMLPREISEGVASLLPPNPKLTVSLCFECGPCLGEEDAKQSCERIKNIHWRLTETVSSSYTYEEAQKDIGTPELTILQKIADMLGNKEGSNTHEIVERLMVFYNQQAGALLAKAGVGILRRHPRGGQTIAGVPEFLAYESAKYCLPGDDTWHFGLNSEFYAYASSPLRRYADLVNQRAIKAIILGKKPNPSSQTLVDYLNHRQKQAKAFSRDLFLTTLGDPSEIEGIVVEQKGDTTKVWIPAWGRLIRCQGGGVVGSRVKIEWYACREQPRWKDKIVFKIIG